MSRVKIRAFRVLIILTLLPSHSLQVAPILLGGQSFWYNALWLVGIYVRDCILKLLLVRAVMKLVKNIVEGVKFTYFMMAPFVRAVEWH